MTTTDRVSLTEAAAAMLRQLRATHGELMFHQSGGCCDGSSPMCYPAGDFLTGDADVHLGDLVVPEEGIETPDGEAQQGMPGTNVRGGSAQHGSAEGGSGGSTQGASDKSAQGAGDDVFTVPVWMSRSQFQYWRHTHLTIDIVPGRGAGFSLEAPEGVRFLIRSRLFTEAETADLETVAG